MNQQPTPTPRSPVSPSGPVERPDPASARPSVAVIPAAGRGRRLSRLETPKPLVEVGGEALIVRQIRGLDRQGVRKIVVVTGYRGHELRKVLMHLPDVSAELILVDNPEWQRGLVESLLCARPHVSEPFILAMGDHIFHPSLINQIMEAELGRSDLVCVVGDSTLLYERELHSPVLMSVDGDRVSDMGRTLDTGTVVDAGLFKCRPEVFDALEISARRGTTDLCEPLSVLARDNRISWQDTGNAYWFDIDSPSDLILAEMRLRLRKRAPERQPGISGTGRTRADTYRFSTGNPSETRIVVERGFVANPEGSAIIPAQSATSPLYLLTDERVGRLYGNTLCETLRSEGYNIQLIALPEGENAKTLQQYSRLADHILTEGIDERSILISLGGGAVCNVCGFLASTLYRGIGLVHIPTTIMAQCDAAISHKQAVNGSRGKNMIGSYYPPQQILVDVDVLETLDDWLVPDGLAEVLKHALAQDADLLEYLLAYDGSLRDPHFLERVIRRNIELKCLLVSRDPKEQREGLVLHYGHTVGHAVEYLAGYKLGHGECVAIGMMVASYVARLMGCCDQATVETHRQVLERFKLPTRIPQDIDLDAIVEMMRYNKRYLVEGTRFALVSAPGRLHQVNGEYGIPVSHQILRKALEKAKADGVAPVYRDSPSSHGDEGTS